MQMWNNSADSLRYLIMVLARWRKPTDRAELPLSSSGTQEKYSPRTAHPVSATSCTFISSLGSPLSPLLWYEGLLLMVTGPKSLNIFVLMHRLLYYIQLICSFYISNHLMKWFWVIMYIFYTWSTEMQKAR